MSVKGEDGGGGGGGRSSVCQHDSQEASYL